MKSFQYYFCIFCLLFSVTFFASAKGSDAEKELNDVTSEAGVRTHSAKGKTSEENVSEESSRKNDGKTNKKSDKNTSADNKLLLTVGGGLGIDLPGIDVVHDGYNNWNDGDSKTITFVSFGFNILANATLTYEIKDQWAIGGAVNLGYNFMGGPNALYEHRYKNERYTNTYRGLGKLYHSFIADLNFAARSPMKKGGDLLMEVGIRLMPTWSSLVWRKEGQTHIGEEAFSNAVYTDPYTKNTETKAYFYGKEAAMMAGPNFFIGIDYFIKDCFDVIGGLRIGTAFGTANVGYISQGITNQSYINSLITIAFEAKFNWWKKF